MATEVTQNNAAVCYEKTVGLYNEYRALSNLAYGKVTKIGELNTFKKYLDGYLPAIVKDMTDNLPSAELADFPKVAGKLNQILQLFDLLDEEDRQNIDADKLAKYKSMASDYVLLYDFTDGNLGKISITTDFGNAWQGTMTTQTDVDYGNVLVCDVKSGHAGDFSRNAEFRVRDASVKTAKYEKIVFYVYCPIDQAIFRCYPSNWKNPYDVKLSANAWNKIEVDASLFVDGTLDGMFFLFISGEGTQPVGVWKVSDFFGYVDKEATNKLVGGFVDVVNGLPATAQLTLADEEAVNLATELYRQFKPYCLNYISQTVLNKYKSAVDKIAELRQASVLDKLTLMVNDLTENSSGEEVYEALYYYTSLPKALQKQADEVVVSKLGSMVETLGVKFAAALDADVYENWTDVSGFLMADPKIVPDPRPIERITYAELRELSYIGAQVLHEGTVSPVREKNIPLNIRNTNQPEHPGTMIREAFDDTAAELQESSMITGIAGKKGFSVITMTKNGMSSELGVIRRVLEILERYHINVEYIPSGIDSVSLVVETGKAAPYLYQALGDMEKEIKPDSLHVTDGMAVVAAVGRKMAFQPGSSGKIFAKLGENGINIRMITQGPEELNIIVGVDSADFEKAIRVLYNSFVK